MSREVSLFRFVNDGSGILFGYPELNGKELPGVVAKKI